jgi:hypothetical protein
LVKGALFSQRFSKNKNDVNPTIGYNIPDHFWQNGRMTINFDCRFMTLDGREGEGWFQGALPNFDCFCLMAGLLRVTDPRSGDGANWQEGWAWSSRIWAGMGKSRSMGVPPGTALYRLLGNIFIFATGAGQLMRLIYVATDAIFRHAQQD